MGCFDVSCGISSITIKHGDPALLLLMIPYTEYAQSTENLGDKIEIEPRLQHVFNEGPLGMYMPFCLPIRGKYNDYGSLEDVVRDETVLALENYFATDIGTILNILGNSYRDLYSSHDGVSTAYGTDLKIESYGNGSEVTHEWLIEAGFSFNEGNYYHPKVRNIILYSEDGVKKTDDPSIYVTFKKLKKEDTILSHVVFWENEKWREIWCRNTADLAKQIFHRSGDEIMLGIKDEFVKKAKLLRKISGMFIDGEFYDEFTAKSDNENVLESYMNKYLMDILGFAIYEDDSVEKPADEPNGWGRNIFYEYPGVPGFIFSVSDSPRNMAVDMYHIKKGKAEKIETYSRGKYYHPFSPNGFAKMFKGETGKDLDLSYLNGYTPLDIKFMKIEDLLQKKSMDKKRAKEISEELEKNPNDDSPERKKIIMELLRLEFRSDSSSMRDYLGYLNFPLVLEMYSDKFITKEPEFYESCRKMLRFIESLWDINRMLIPSAHFVQHGEYKPQLQFNKVVSKVIKNKIKRHDRY